MVFPSAELLRISLRDASAALQDVVKPPCPDTPMAVDEIAALHDAAGRGDVSAVQDLLKDGVAANSRAHTHR